MPWTWSELLEAVVPVALEGPGEPRTYLRRVGVRYQVEITEAAPWAELRRVGRLRVFDFDEAGTDGGPVELTGRVGGEGLAQLEMQVEQDLAGRVRAALALELEEPRAARLVAAVVHGWPLPPEVAKHLGFRGEPGAGES